MLKTEGEARGFQHFPADIKSVTSLLVPFLNKIAFEAGDDQPTHRPMIRGSIEYKIGQHISQSSANYWPIIG